LPAFDAGDASVDAGQALADSAFKLGEIGPQLGCQQLRSSFVASFGA
jgi:hypothetical protein